MDTEQFPTTDPQVPDPAGAPIAPPETAQQIPVEEATTRVVQPVEAVAGAPENDASTPEPTKSPDKTYQEDYEEKKAEEMAYAEKVSRDAIIALKASSLPPSFKEQKIAELSNFAEQAGSAAGEQYDREQQQFIDDFSLAVDRIVRVAAGVSPTNIIEGANIGMYSTATGDERNSIKHSNRLLDELADFIGAADVSRVDEQPDSSTLLLKGENLPVSIVVHNRYRGLDETTGEKLILARNVKVVGKDVTDFSE